MPISRARKEELVASYVDLLEGSAGFAIVRVKGMTVAEVDQLRHTIRDAGGLYAVTKNTLITKALEQAGWVVPDELLSGPTAIVFGRENFPGVAKALLKYIDDSKHDPEKFSLAGGVMGTDVLSPQGVDDASNLPTLDELRGQIVGLLASPSQGLVNVLYANTSGLVNVLQAGTTQVVNVLQAYINKLEQGEDDAA